MSPYISGASTICTSGTTFTVNNLPPGVTIEWTTGPYLTRSSPQGSNPCTFVSTGSGSSWVRVNLVSSCDNIVLPQKNVWSGLPDITVYSEGGDGGYVGNSFLFYTFPNEGDVIEWSVYPGGYVTQQYGQYNEYALIYFDTPGYHSIMADVTNSCGTAMAYHDFQVYGDYLLSPNPASTVVTITVNKDKTVNVASDRVYDVSILDMHGSLKTQDIYSGDKFEIPIQNLKDGFYFIKINNGKTTVTKQLVIKR
ncbi:MAG TPA: T9SS type A sorting domain-containing protein [Bacteroidales bacterium]|nr:T9SS type A sorting domain-containing protein [Bacteroidales bacterium]